MKNNLNGLVLKVIRKIPVFGGGLSKLYVEHTRFFNDGIVELVCLIISTMFVMVASYRYIGIWLGIVSICVITPVTFCLKYFLHKYWVWKTDVQNQV